MKKLYQSSTKVQIKWLEKFKLFLNTPDKKDSICDIDKTIGILNRMEKIEPSENIPKSDHFQLNEPLMPKIYDEIFSINSRGDEYICSTSEALIKCNGLKRLFDKDFQRPSYFRGEHKFGRELISKFGRGQKIDWKNTDPLKVTGIELEAMDKFQKQVKQDDDLRNKIFGESDILGCNDAGWWSLMQHYNKTLGTRMIDVTSSLFCALYFACVDRNGEIRSDFDGKLYFFPMGISRGETDTPLRFKNSLIDDHDQKQITMQDYYKIEGREDIPRFRISPVRNDRALSQDGLFIWQAKFDLPLEPYGMYTFRIHREFKESILQELQSMGYTKERILSKDRFYKSLPSKNILTNIR